MSDQPRLPNPAELVQQAHENLLTLIQQMEVIEKTADYFLSPVTEATKTASAKDKLIDKNSSRISQELSDLNALVVEAQIRMKLLISRIP